MWMLSSPSGDEVVPKGEVIPVSDRVKVQEQKESKPQQFEESAGVNNGMRRKVNNRNAYEKDCQCIAIDEGLLVSSDAADVGSEVRDSLLGGNSEGDVESVRYQELASYAPAHGTVRSQDFSSKEGRHVEVESAPICHLDKHEDERDMIL
ncbi:hypothetical protein L7F22_033044 [Adiantum nelumboides]|nr:hypothetical protein [Adiantum nelumboides]